jgi:prepilin-type N-terminal cleavage/methylation domain-containing protein
MTRTVFSRQHNRMGFTLIELTTSLAVMSVLLLGLSGAVMVSSRAIPTATETGLADQNVVDVLDQLRNDLRAGTQIRYRTTASGFKIVSYPNQIGAVGEPTNKVKYVFVTSTGVLTREVDAGTPIEMLTGIQSFAMSITTKGSKVSNVYGLLSVESTIQRFFEMNAALPDNPEAL